MMEVILSMALIIMVSAAALTCCYLATRQQVNSKNLIHIQTVAESTKTSFSLALERCPKGESDEKKQDFVTEFNELLSFAYRIDFASAVGAEIDVKGFSTAWTVTVPQDGKTSVTVDHPVYVNNSTSYFFTYTYTTASYSVKTEIVVRNGDYYFDQTGYTSGSDKAIYQFKGQY